MNEIDNVVINKDTILSIANEKRKFNDKKFENIYNDLCKILNEFVFDNKIENITSKNLISEWEKYKEKRALEYVTKNHKKLLNDIQEVINISNLKDLKFEKFENKIDFKFTNSEFKFLKYIEYEKEDYHLIPKHLHEFIYFLNCNIANYKKEIYTDKYIKIINEIFNINSTINPDPLYQI